MGLNSTVYDVQVRYSLDDKASSALAHLGDTASRTERSVGGLKEGLKSLGELLLAREAFRAGKELFVDFNSEMEQLKISLGAVAAVNFSMPFDEAAKKTDILVDKWQKFSQSTTLTTREITEFGKNVAASVAVAGGSLQDIDEITRRGAVVASALVGDTAGGLNFAGIELSEALIGGVRKQQRFNMQLLVPELKKMHLTIEDFNRATYQDRLKMLKAAISDPAWDGAVKRMTTSWKGVTSTLKDTIEIVGGGKAGGFIFKELEKEIRGVNDWLKANETLVEQYAHSFGKSMLSAFESLRDAVKFLIDHKDALITIGEVWLGSKALGAFGVGSALGGARGMGGYAGLLEGSAASRFGAGKALFGKAAGGALLGVALEGLHDKAVLGGNGLYAFSDVLAKSQHGIAAITGAMAALPGTVGMVGTALFAFYEGLRFISDWFDSKHRDSINASSEFATIKDDVGDKKGKEFLSLLQQADTAKSDEQKQAIKHTLESQFGSLLVTLKESGAFVKEGPAAGRINNLDFIKYLQNKGGLDEASAVFGARMAKELTERLNPDFVARMLGLPGAHKAADGTTTTDPLAKSKSGPPPKVEVNINKIEVASPDPDRFAFQFGRAVGRIVRNPTQARDSFREG